MIGSDVAAEVRLESPGIRPFHCAIGMRGKEIPAVWDLGVESRTQINGQRHMVATVAQGDLPTIGGMSFRIHLQVVTAMRSSLAGQPSAFKYDRTPLVKSSSCVLR